MHTTYSNVGVHLTPTYYFAAVLAAESTGHGTMSESEPIWRLTYWPGFPGRGECIRLLFVEAGVSYEESSDVTGRGFKTGTAGPTVDGPEGWPCFAVPFLEKLDTGLQLSQTPVICRYERSLVRTK